MESTENLHDVGEQLHALFVSATAKLEQSRLNLLKDRELFEREKAAMSSPHVNDSDVLELNVSGEIMAVRRRTLCQVPGSLLEAMFSGRWDAGLARDAQQRIFLELNPVCFRALLDALTYTSLQPSSKLWRQLVVPDQHQIGLMAMLTYLGFVHDIDSRLVRHTDFDDVRPSMEEDGRTVRLDPEDPEGVLYLLSSSPLPSGYMCRWEVAVYFTPSEDSNTFIGIAHASEEQKELNTHTWYDGSNAYGWGFRCFMAGKWIDAAGWDGFKRGDVVTITLDAAACSLGMVVRRGASSITQCMALPSDTPMHSWYVTADMEPSGEEPATMQLVSCRAWL